MGHVVQNLTKRKKKLSLNGIVNGTKPVFFIPFSTARFLKGFCKILRQWINHVEVPKRALIGRLHTDYVSSDAQIRTFHHPPNNQLTHQPTLYQLNPPTTHAWYVFDIIYQFLTPRPSIRAQTRHMWDNSQKFWKFLGGGGWGCHRTSRNIRVEVCMGHI